MNNSPWEAQYTLRFIKHQYLVLWEMWDFSPNKYRRMSEHVQSILLPYWRWRTNPSPYVTQVTSFLAPLWGGCAHHLWARTAIRLKVKEIAFPECSGHDQLSPFLQKLTKHHLTSMVSPIISASSIQKHQEGKTWSIIYMFLPYKWGLWTFLRYYFLYFHSFMC